MTERKVVLTDPRKHDYFYDEASKTLRTNIRFTGVDTKTIVITSCFPNEGKSDVLFQLALEIGNMGKRVLVVDADIRNSRYVTRFQVGQSIRGLSEYLSGQVGGAEIIYTTNFPGMDIIFSGPVAPNPSELLEQRAFALLLETMREKYDYILVDTPPIGNLSDAAIVAKQCDAAILVIENERVSRSVAIKAKEQLEMSGCRLMGAVLNKVDVRSDRYYSKYSGYYKKKSGKEKEES